MRSQQLHSALHFLREQEGEKEQLAQQRTVALTDLEVKHTQSINQVQLL